MPGRRKKSQSKPNNNKSKGENQRMTQNWPKHVQTFSSESVPKEVEDCCCCNTNSLAHYSMEVAHSLHLGGSSQQDLCLNRNQIWNEDNTVSENRKNNTTWHLLPFLIASAKKKNSPYHHHVSCLLSIVVRFIHSRNLVATQQAFAKHRCLVPTRRADPSLLQSRTY